MAKSNFYTKWLGIDRVKKVLGAVATGASVAFGSGKLEELLLERTLARFDPEGSNLYAQKSPDGVKWAELADSTKRKRSNKDYSQKLVDTGAMRDKITILNKAPLEKIKSAFGATSIIGIQPGTKEAKIGEYHQSGTPRMPARPWLGVNEKDMNDMNKLVRKDILDRVRRII